MARRSDIQYIRFYTDGNTARELQPVQPKKKVRLPRPRRKKTVAIHIDPVAVCGILVAVVLLISLILGMNSLYRAYQEKLAMEQYVTTLQQENLVLQHTDQQGYDLENVERSAIAMGMVPSDQVQNIRISVERPVEEEPTHWWDNVFTFLAGLFA